MDFIEIPTQTPNELAENTLAVKNKTTATAFSRKSYAGKYLKIILSYQQNISISCFNQEKKNYNNNRDLMHLPVYSEKW